MGHSSTRAALICLHAARDGHQRIADGIDRKLAAQQAEDGDGPEGGDDGAGQAGFQA